MIDHACRHHLEGVVSKRADAPYEQRRSGNWVKSKCLKRQDFVIGGWTEPSGSRFGFGALLLGHYESGKFVYSGRVGTGFTAESLLEIQNKLKTVASKTAPFASPPTGVAARGVHWVLPKLVAEVEFTEWTADGMLRHPSFKGLREDKLPESITRETATPVSNLKSTSKRLVTTAKEFADSVVAGVRITHPERVVYPEQGVTKLELAEYYADIADWILPCVANRPLTLVRCPQRPR